MPKSLSALYVATGDERLVDMIRLSVRQTMASVEDAMMARVRTGGRSFDRPTRNFAWAEFVHFTTRPVEARDEADMPAVTPDPNIHVHAVVPSETWDDVEGKWKALQLEAYGKGKDWSLRPRFQAEFYSRLAENLRGIGYRTRRTGLAFEIDGVPERVNQEFSRRREAIDALARELGIATPQGRAVIARTSRRRKDRHIDWEELHASWLRRIRPDEMDAMQRVCQDSLEADAPELADAPAVDWALAHLLSRSSVVSERDLAVQAMLRGLGTATADGILGEVGSRNLIRAEVDGLPMISTPEVLAEEIAVLDFARERRSKLKPLAGRRMFQDARLSAEQRQAVRHVWNSRDPITLIRGKAGTGKTTMMREAIAGITAGGRAVTVLAPTAAAAYDVLRDKEGFQDATTVANFLDKPELQDAAKGGVLWVDEAGLLGFADMAALTRAADRLGARIVLSGDRKQLRAVARGEPLAVLEDLAGLPVAELGTIRRQQGDYKAAVELLAEGKVAEGLERLDAMGAIKPMPDGDPYAPLVEEYLQGVRDGKHLLVLSPTHREGEAITALLRQRLRQEGRLGGDEREFERLVPLYLTDAERADPVAITGVTAVFSRRAGKYRPGDRVEVTLANADAIARVPEAFTAVRRSTIALAAGDLLRITGNGRDRTGKHRVNNGGVYRVQGFDATGGVILDNGWVLDKAFGKWAPGYVSTSFGGQGKTVDRVLLAVSSQSYAAANARQAYVDASRGREGISIYCEDPDALRRAMSHDRQRLHAIDLVARQAAPRPTYRHRVLEHVAFRRRVDAARPATVYRDDRRLAQAAR